MQETSFITTFGERATIRRSDTGNVLCPICGIEYADSRDWILEAFVLHQEFCPGCHTQMGVHDMHGLPPIDPSNPIMRRWAKLRVKWLDRIEWPDWAIAQVKNALGLTREEIKELAK